MAESDALYGDELGLWCCHCGVQLSDEEIEENDYYDNEPDERECRNCFTLP